MRPSTSTCSGPTKRTWRTKYVSATAGLARQPLPVERARPFGGKREVADVEARDVVEEVRALAHLDVRVRQRRLDEDPGARRRRPTPPGRRATDRRFPSARSRSGGTACPPRAAHGSSRRSPPRSPGEWRASKRSGFTYTTSRTPSTIPFPMTRSEERSTFQPGRTSCVDVDELGRDRHRTDLEEAEPQRRVPPSDRASRRTRSRPVRPAALPQSERSAFTTSFSAYSSSTRSGAKLRTRDPVTPAPGDETIRRRRPTWTP